MCVLLIGLPPHTHTHTHTPSLNVTGGLFTPSVLLLSLLQCCFLKRLIALMLSMHSGVVLNVVEWLGEGKGTPPPPQAPTGSRGLSMW